MRIFVFQSAATADEQISDMNIENYIEQAAARAVERLYPQAAGAPIQIQRTRREFEGDARHPKPRQRRLARHSLPATTVSNRTT